MGLSEDLQAYLREEEERKSSYGGLSAAPFEPYDPETYGTQATPQSDRFFLWDALGQGAWKFADELLFGIPGIAAEEYAPDFTEQYLQPTGFAGKAGGAVGGLVGFLKGPLAAGNILTKGAVKGIGQASSEKALKQASKSLKGKLTDDTAREMSETVMEGRLRGLVGRAKMNKDIAFDKGFRKHAWKVLTMVRMH